MSKNKERKERKKADIPETETKEQRFIRVATPRVKKTITQIVLVKQTVSGNNYLPSEQQIGTIVTRLHEEVDSIQSAFNARNKSKTAVEINL